MRALEDFMNRLADLDGGWWPFLHLRPARDEFMDDAVLLRMSLRFGPIAGILVAILDARSEHATVAPISVGITLVLATVAFFVGYKFTFAVAWNSRAARLRSGTSAGHAS